MTDIKRLLTVSRLRTYRECAKKHEIEYLLQYRPRKVGDALAFGTMWHMALEGWWRWHAGERTHATAQAAAHAATKDKSPADSHHAVTPDVAERATMDRVQVTVLLSFYDALYGDMARASDVLGVERPFQAPLMNPVTGRRSQNWSIAGKVDGVLRDSEGRIWIVEHKTTRDDLQGGAADYFLKLAMDAQITHYLIGGMQMGYTEDIEGVLYDVVRRPSEKILRATPKDKRKFKQDGTLYKNQRDTDETLSRYATRITTRIAADTPDFFHQRRVRRTIVDMAEYLSDIWVTALAMRESEIVGVHPRNPEACNRFGRCPWWDACAYGRDLRDNPDWVRIDTAHPELKGDTTSD